MFGQPEAYEAKTRKESGKKCGVECNSEWTPSENHPGISGTGAIFFGNGSRNGAQRKAAILILTC
jgi:hypothetical protein